ncbi:hypothetical protein GCM10015535_32710 [Streptomyces gelaticus]|uniref:NADP-dependent oxidoreductase domain-containing protein n=1 Tax=Streptomyces gelaticus TaxID=285446 RepID=A0ABQ2VYY1_9ACTN|nr:hypothetical protein GCM10015535_32710 [Streptomyces gelaticus]
MDGLEEMTGTRDQLCVPLDRKTGSFRTPPVWQQAATSSPDIVAVGTMNLMTIKTFSLGGDLTINRLGSGAMRLSMSTFDGPSRAPESGIAVLRRAVELGVNHIDTAAFYGSGETWANELIRTALTPYRDDLVIATKVGPVLGAEGVPSEQATPDQLRGLVEADLRSLGLNRLDLVYLRVGGMAGPGGQSITERFAALAELQAEGLIRHLGVSNVDTVQFAEARAIAPVAAAQNQYTGPSPGHAGPSLSDLADPW